MLKVHSIFESISGEVGCVFPQGTWCTFIRLQGCNLRCNWCDTAYAQELEKGKEMSYKEIADEVETKHVLITGGEPLLQNISPLIRELIFERGKIVQIETNGSFEIPKISKPPYYYFLNDPFSYGIKLGWVIDYKLPSSGHTSQMHPIWKTSLRFKYYSPDSCIIKFVIDSKQKSLPGMLLPDLSAVLIIIDRFIDAKYLGNFIISPVVSFSTSLLGSCVLEVVDAMKKSRPELLDRIIFSPQLHKILDLP